MTLNEFMDALSKTPRKWKFTWADRFRCGPYQLCPIEQVARSKHLPWDRGADVAGRRLGLSDEAIHQIMRAADVKLPSTRRLRARLLRACGLKEKP